MNRVGPIEPLVAPSVGCAQAWQRLHAFAPVSRCRRSRHATK